MHKSYGMTKRGSSRFSHAKSSLVFISILMMRTSSEANVMCLFPFNSIQIQARLVFIHWLIILIVMSYDLGEI